MIKHKSMLLTYNSSKNGVRIITIGLMSMLKLEVEKVAFFKFLTDEKENDSDIHFMTQHFKLKQNPETAYGMTIEESRVLIENKENSLLYEKIMERYTFLLSNYDFVLCQGIDTQVDECLIDDFLNFKIAQNLQIPIIEIVNGNTLKNIQEAKKSIDDIKYVTSQYNTVLLGVFFNRLSATMMSQIKKEIDTDFPLFLLPETFELNQPSISDILSQTDVKLLTKHELSLDKNISNIKIAAMNLEHYLDYFEEGDLIIVTSDRIDIIIGTLLASSSPAYPACSAILLSGDMFLKKTLDKLLSNLEIPIVPILSLNVDLNDALEIVKNVSSEITLESKRKIALILGLFNQYVDMKILEKKISLKAPAKMTPARFIYTLYERARSSPMRILLPESNDERILHAADSALHQGLCEITLLGNAEEIHNHCSILGLDLSKADIINPQLWNEMDKFIETYYELSKHKGVTKQTAQETMSRINYFSTMLLHLGYVDGIVSGATQTTRETIKPAFQIIQTKEEVKLVSSVFFMLLDNSVLVYADCAVNPDPDPEQLADIAISSAKTAKIFGIEPKVAMLSYSSGDSGVGADVEKVRQATHIAQILAPDILIDGPMQYDTAIDAKVAAQKMPDSKVAGNATVFIFPELNTGNNTYKAVQRSAGAMAIGPILQGLKKPVNDLSRGAELSDIIYTIVITAIQAAEGKLTS